MIGRGKSSDRNRSAKSQRSAQRACIEKLDVRQLLSVSVSGGILTVDDQNQSTSAHIVVDVDPSTGNYRVNDTGTITEEPQSGIDSLNVLAPQPATTSNYVEVDATFPNAVNANGLNGGDGSDTILGSPGRDVIFGSYDLVNGTGADSLAGRGGNDSITGGPGNDTVTGGAGDDQVDGGIGADEVHGGIGDDQVIGSAGADTLFGGAGNDSLYGKAGADVEFAGGGNDFVNGGKGPDTLFGQAGSDTISGGKGRDALVGDNEDFLPVGGATVAAGTGTDSLAGGLGADTILAQGGSDTISGGPGPDDFNVLASDSLVDFDSTNGDFQPSQQLLTGQATTDVTVTLTINAYGQAVPIPSTAGNVTGGTSVAEVTSVTGNTATVQFRSATSRTFTLGDFFNQWGITLSPLAIGRFATGPHDTLTMTVNGVANTNFASYVVQNGDNIVLSYT